MTLVLLFACAKDAKLVPLAVQSLRRNPSLEILLCDDVRHPSNVGGLPTIEWDMRGEGGWAGGVARAFSEASQLYPQAQWLAKWDADLMALDPTFLSPPDHLLARGCLRPDGDWFSLYLMHRSLIPGIQGAAGDEEDRIIGRLLKQLAGNRILADGVIHASPELDPPLQVFRRLGCHAIHTGEFRGDHGTREKAFIQATNILNSLARE